MSQSLLEQTKEEEMSRGDGRIFKHPQSAVWHCAYYHNGKQVRQSTGETDEKKARNFLKLRIKEVGADFIGAKPFTTPQHNRITVNEIIDDVLAKYCLGGKRGIRREVPRQMHSHAKALRDFFGDRPAMQVGSKGIDAFKAKLKGKANSTINRSLQLLQQAYKLAVNSEPPKLPRALKIEMLDESDNHRKGKFTPADAESVACSLPLYMSDVARFAYQTGARASEILQLRWPYVEDGAIKVPGSITKNRTDRSIALTEELEDILARRRRDMRPGCDLIFHRNGERILDYRKCWHTACVSVGLGAYYCRDCRDAEGHYTSRLDAEKKCSHCGEKCGEPRYIGKIFHDFRRSAAHELWVAGSSVEDCMKVTGHKTASMFKRYADLFTDPEQQARQREAQHRRREWREAQQANVPAATDRVQ
jgi:integrase